MDFIDVQAFIDFARSPTGVLTLLTGGASAGSAVLSWFSSQSAGRKAAQAEAQAEEAGRIQQQMQQDSLAISGQTLKTSFEKQIFAWGECVILLLADAQALAMRRGLYGDAHEFAATRDSLAARISGYVDQGRLFFLNDSADLVGLDRPPAMRGYRPPVLDAAMLVYLELTAIDPAGTAPAKVEGDAIFQARRAFISELQKALDPGRRRAVLDRLVTNREEEEKELKKLTELAGEKDTVNWVDVSPLVDKFEERHGQGVFWRERPRTRSEVLGKK